MALWCPVSDFLILSPTFRTRGSWLNDPRKGHPSDAAGQTVGGDDSSEVRKNEGTPSASATLDSGRVAWSLCQPCTPKPPILMRRVTPEGAQCPSSQS